MKILIAASGSHDNEEDASVRTAASFPWPDGSEIHVLSVAEVIHPVMVGMIPDVLDTSDVRVTTGAEARGTAVHVAEWFRNRGFQAEGVSMDGDPETAILEHAARWGADLIVVGAHDRSRVERFLMGGGISEAIVKQASCSVLVLKVK